MNKHHSALIITALLAMLAAQPCVAATLVVTNTSASGPGSLRQAVLDATNGMDTIVFQIPGGGVHTIALTSALPAKRARGD
jgi:hypothetical protein